MILSAACEDLVRQSKFNRSRLLASAFAASRATTNAAATTIAWTIDRGLFPPAHPPRPQLPTKNAAMKHRTKPCLAPATALPERSGTNARSPRP